MVKMLSETRSGIPDDGLVSRLGGFQGAVGRVSARSGGREGGDCPVRGRFRPVRRAGGSAFGPAQARTARCACPREKAPALPRGNCPAHAARLDGYAGRIPRVPREWAPAPRLRHALAAGESRGTGWVSHVPAKGLVAELAGLPASTGHWRYRAGSIGLRCRYDGERGSSPRMHAGHRSVGRALQTIRVRALARNGAAGQTRYPEEFRGTAPQAVCQQQAGAGQPGLERKAAAPCGRGSRSSVESGRGQRQPATTVPPVWITQP